MPQSEAEANKATEIAVRAYKEIREACPEAATRMAIGQTIMVMLCADFFKGMTLPFIAANFAGATARMLSDIIYHATGERLPILPVATLIEPDPPSPKPKEKLN